ncbi:MAG TPA: phosphoribosylaminoimidazolesuccinocarboxamide synthase [Nitrososphaeraceae archaeon]|nr:phosphoribosylaminoimidazolesuccinocarboxamide synthase [Nitrososphaeraceae archaeon]
MKLLHKGKVKDIYEYKNENTLLFVFSNRISAFDIEMHQEIPRKGELLCKFAKFWFDNLNINNHMIKMVDNNKMVVEKLSMIPIECVVRGYFYGSLVDRYHNKQIDIHSPPVKLTDKFRPRLACKLPEPLFDPTTKSLEHDSPISKNTIISSHIISEHDFDYIKVNSIRLYEEMSTLLEKAGFIIADVKFEFGINRKGEIILGDSLGPDEFRIWKKENYQEGKIQESYDKQILRDWLSKIGFKEKILEEIKYNKKPEPPTLPLSLIEEILNRYVYAYEIITGNKFN